MKQALVTVAVTAALILLVGSPITGGPDTSSRKSFKAHLDGYQAAPLTILTDATGEFQAKVDESGQEIAFTLEYSGFREEDTVSGAYIRFGQPGLVGGTIFTLCEKSTSEDGNEENACLPPGVKMEGYLHEDDVQGLVDQGIPEHDFAAALRALRSGATYVAGPRTWRWKPKPKCKSGKPREPLRFGGVRSAARSGPPGRRLHVAEPSARAKARATSSVQPDIEASAAGPGARSCYVHHGNGSRIPGASEPAGPNRGPGPKIVPAASGLSAAALFCFPMNPAGAWKASSARPNW